MQFDHYRCVPEPLGGDWTGREIDPAQFKRAWFNVPYADQTSTQQLDVVLPDEGDGPFPVIFYIHGGGWLSGDKRADTFLWPYISEQTGSFDAVFMIGVVMLAMIALIGAWCLKQKDRLPREE